MKHLQASARLLQPSCNVAATKRAVWEAIKSSQQYLITLVVDATLNRKEKKISMFSDDTLTK